MMVTLLASLVWIVVMGRALMLLVRSPGRSATHNSI